MQESHKRVQWVYSSTSDKELEERYDQWATEYDADLENSFVWLAPKMVADVFAEYVKPAAHVLDAGAGTGMSGQALAELGFNNVVAMDLSQGMLDEAKTKNVYIGFDQMALGMKNLEVQRFQDSSCPGPFCTPQDKLPPPCRPRPHGRQGTY